MIAGQIPGWEKSIEVRSRTTTVRGPILIVAGLENHEDDPDGGWDTDDLPHGVALCVVDIVDSQLLTREQTPLTRLPDTMDAWGWHLSNVRVLDEPFRVTGRLGFFPVEPPNSFFDQFPELRPRTVEDFLGTFPKIERLHSLILDPARQPVLPLVPEPDLLFV